MLLAENADLKRQNAELRDVIARLKGLKGRPQIKPSGMEDATTPNPGDSGASRRRRGKIVPRVSVADQILEAEVPPGSRFKGYEDFVVQELELRVRAIRYRRARWLTPDGRTVIAPLPPGVRGHFGPELRRFVLMQYQQGQVTVPRLVAQLQAIGVSISKRQLVRLLIAGQDEFLAEARDVLRAGLQTATWVSVDDTGARHQGVNGVCTQIGNDDFAWFGTTRSKSRLNFLDHRIKSGDKPAAGRTHRLRDQRGGFGLHARTRARPADHYPAGRAPREAVCRSGGLAGAS
jgi:hypothetical protein